MTTAHELLTLPLDELHIEIASAYTASLSLRRQSAQFSSDAKNPRHSDFYNLKKHSQHMAEIKMATAQRVEKWCRKMVTLKYATL